MHLCFSLNYQNSIAISDPHDVVHEDLVRIVDDVLVSAHKISIELLQLAQRHRHILHHFDVAGRVWPLPAQSMC